jgi:hypothetical protein
LHIRFSFLKIMQRGAFRLLKKPISVGEALGIFGIQLVLVLVSGWESYFSLFDLAEIDFNGLSRQNLA